jgi:hypothetical protein
MFEVGLSVAESSPLLLTDPDEFPELPPLPPSPAENPGIEFPELPQPA